MVTKEQFKQGMTIEQYLAQMGTNKDKFVEFLGSITARSCRQGRSTSTARS